MITVVDIVPDLRWERLSCSAANLASNETHEIIHIFRFQQLPNDLIWLCYRQLVFNQILTGRYQPVWRRH
jgi:hypothetical protein